MQVFIVIVTFRGLVEKVAPFSKREHADQYANCEKKHREINKQEQDTHIAVYASDLDLEA